MKHYKELMDVETVSIDLDVLVGAVRVMSYGIPEANRNDVEYAMHNITNQLNLINHRLRDAFDVLFNNIREEANNEAEKPGKSKRNKVSA
jgi:hypothetical protein